jgi:RNase P/RNase MRP subunit POP5
MTLKRRYRRRYIVVLCRSSSEDLLSATRDKAISMFGHVMTQKAFLKIIGKIGPDLHVIRCKSEYVGEILCTITLVEAKHASVVLDISGTLRSLRTRLMSRRSSVDSVLGTVTQS